MTPDRKELADTCLRLAEDRGHAIAPAVRCALRLAADALRQEPSVEEVARIINEWFAENTGFDVRDGDAREVSAYYGTWVAIRTDRFAQAILATISKGRDG